MGKPRRETNDERGLIVAGLNFELFFGLWVRGFCAGAQRLDYVFLGWGAPGRNSELGRIDASTDAVAPFNYSFN